MLAAAIQVHVVLEAEPGIGLLDVREQDFGLYLLDHDRSSRTSLRPPDLRVWKWDPVVQTALTQRRFSAVIQIDDKHLHGVLPCIKGVSKL